MRTARLVWPLGLTLLTAGVGQAAELPAEKPPLGEWMVTELTGSITSRTDGEPPPYGICLEAGEEETVAAVLDSELNFISLGWDKSALGGTYEKPPPGIPERLTRRQAKRPFLFSFAFETGHHTNSLSSPDPRGGGLRELRFSNPWSSGYWGLGDDGGGIVQGFVVIAQEKLGRGTSKFTVDGTFQGQGRERLEGHWSFEEAISGFGCTWISKGQGRWAAVPKR